MLPRAARDQRGGPLTSGTPCGKAQGMRSVVVLMLVLSTAACTSGNASGGPSGYASADVTVLLADASGDAPPSWATGYESATFCDETVLQFAPAADGGNWQFECQSSLPVQAQSNVSRQ